MQVRAPPRQNTILRKYTILIPPILFVASIALFSFLSARVTSPVATSPNSKTFKEVINESMGTTQSSTPRAVVTTSILPKNTKLVYVRLPELSDDEVIRYAAYIDDSDDTNKGAKKAISIWDWATLIARDDENSKAEIRKLIETLKGIPFAAFRFETKGCTYENSKEKAFEFAVVKDSFLSSFAADADPSAFAEHFQSPKQRLEAVAVFENLGGSALLVAPKPWKNSSARYGHLGNFVRTAPAAQVEAAFQIVAENFLKRLESKQPATVWFSTAGTGIAWLHFRFDRRPKYYHYDIFARET